MMADVADYSEWRNRRRATAIVFSAIVFALKAGLGFGGAITGYVLAHYGYVPNVAQTATALDGIRLDDERFPGDRVRLCAACLFFYSIDKAAEIRITQRAQGAPEAVRDARAGAGAAVRASDASSIAPLAALAVAITSPTAQPALKSLTPPDLRLGVALSAAQVDGGDPRSLSIATDQFNSITPENLLKWEAVHPAPDRFDFAAADRFVELGERHGMFVVGHMLVWHQQTPDWVFAGRWWHPRGSRHAAVAACATHILTVVGRYRGRIHGWDVVNEALEEDGTLRRTPWSEGIGDDYIAKAFEFAREADPRGGALLQRLQPVEAGEARRRHQDRERAAVARPAHRWRRRAGALGNWGAFARADRRDAFATCPRAPASR